MRLSLAVLAASVAAYAVSPDGGWVSFFRIGHGTAFALATTVNFAHFMEVVATDTRRGRAVGAFMAAQSGGRALGNFLGGFFGDQLGFSGAFLAASLFPLLAICLLPAMGRPASRLSGGASDPGPQLRRTAIRKLGQLKNTGVMRQTIFGFSINFLFESMTGYFPLYALSAGLSLTSIGVMKSVNSICGIITRPFTGELTRFVGYNLITNTGIVLGALLIALMPSFQDAWPLGVVLVASGVVRGAVSVTNRLAVVEATEKEPQRRGMAAGIFSTGQDLGGIAGPIVGGVVASQIGLSGMLRFAPWLVIGVYLLLLVVTRLQQRRKARALA